MGKWFLVIMLLLVALTSVVVVFTITGVIQPQTAIINAANSVHWLAPHIETYRIGQDAEEWKAKKVAEIEQSKAEYANRLAALDDREQQLSNLEMTIGQQRTQFEEIKAEAQNIQRLAELYQEMRPEEAISILELMDEDLVFAVVTAMDTETASLVLAGFPTDLAAKLSSRFQ